MPATDLLREHARFDEVVRAMRRAAFERRIPRVAALNRWLVAALDAHMGVEERHLIPALAELGAEAPNGAPEVFRRDHALILRQILAVGDLLDPGADPVALCDALARLHGLLQHHDQREERYLLGRLDRDLPADRIAGWLRGHREPAPLPDGPSEVWPAPRPEPGAGFDAARRALAAGEVALAVDALSEPAASGGKAERHRAAALILLRVGDPVGAWDRLALGRLASVGSRRGGGQQVAIEPGTPDPSTGCPQRGRRQGPGARRGEE